MKEIKEKQGQQERHPINLKIMEKQAIAINQSIRGSGEQYQVDQNGKMIGNYSVKNNIKNKNLLFASKK